MKTKILILAAISYSLVGFSQKNELKDAEKALKSGDAVAAKAAIESASGLIGGADDKMKAEYYLLRGNIYQDLAQKGDATAFDVAIKGYNDLIALEAQTGKQKYTVEAQQKLTAISGDLVNSAVTDNQEKRFKEAGEKLYMSYNLSKKDTIYLYYAASSAVNGGHYEQALTYYNELKDVGYDGSEMKYTAVNIETGEVGEMAKNQRELMMKAGAYKDPKDEKTSSKTSEIVKNIALIYTQLGQDDKALEAYRDARATDPSDVNLILNEANLYFKLGDKEKFKALMSEAAEVAPDNPDLFYNIGVINMEQGNLEAARDAYKRAMEITQVM